MSAVGHIRTQPRPLDLSIATGRAGRDQRPAHVSSSLAAVIRQRLAVEKLAGSILLGFHKPTIPFQKWEAEKVAD
jgi:hypothetical protein